MTPAVNLLKKARVAFQVHQYHHEPGVDSYGAEAARELGVDPSRVFKTLLVALDNSPKQLAVAIVPVDGTLNLKAVGEALKCKKVAMADALEAQRATGYLVGGISPLGQKKRLPTLIDSSAEQLESLFISGGKRGLDIELAPSDLARLTGARFAPIGRG
ncbi:Cys-tRNA(Pro) deacylase [Motiliproteus sp. SC1-56]|uniref:Cys-tRNA(Pro) deacylase n=1 Tax=Motiliproteus sp. SC1-56 TaxID=2799565 RepID=UPI001A8E026D|nr:Cys-tRNA(Pro) deacylase [Motiliproteus sp. SC1-56]